MKQFGFLLLIASVFSTPIEERSIGQRIVGGAEASAGQFPWMAAVYFTTIDDRSSFCGGSLVHERWVLSAGHCAQNVTLFTIYVGSNSLVAVDNNRVIRTTNVSYVHPEYDPTDFSYDVALIDLLQPVIINDFVQPIAIDFEFFVTLIREVYVSGWGKTIDTSTTISETLHYVALRTISNAECQSYYGPTMTGLVICALGTGQSTCDGDNGSPLIYFNPEGIPELVGVSVFVSSAGCSSSYPSGYTRVNYAAEWIRNYTNL